MTSIGPPRATPIPGVSQGLALVSVSALPTMAIVSLVPILPLLFKRFGDQPHAGVLVPMILTIPSLCIAIFSPLMGVLADSWGRRRLLLIAILTFSALGVLPAFLDQLPAILATRFPVGMAEAAIFTTQNALLGDYFVNQERQKWLGILSLLNPILAALLVLAGGTLGSLNWHAPFLLYLLGLPMFAWVALSVFEPDSSISRKERPSGVGTAFPWVTALAVAATTVAVAILYFLQAVQLGRIFSEHGLQSPAAIGVYVIIASVGVVAGGWVYPRLARLSPRHRFALIFACYAVGYVALGRAPSADTSLLAAVIAQFGNGLAVPTLIGWSLDRFEVSHRGRGMGIWTGCFFAGAFVSPLFATLLGTLTHSFLATVFLFGIIAVLFMLCALLWKGRNETGSAGADGR